MNNYKNSISIIVPSIYPDLWPSIIENYNSKSVHVEIIFIGPKECKFLLPKRVKFIKTNFKVVQCLEMGLRSATSFYIFESCDDVMFKAEGSLYTTSDLNISSAFIASLSAFLILNTCASYSSHCFSVLFAGCL